MDEPLISTTTWLGLFSSPMIRSGMEMLRSSLTQKCPSASSIVSPGLAFSIASGRLRKWLNSIFFSSRVYAPISTGYTCNTKEGSVAALRHCRHTWAAPLNLSGWGDRNDIMLMSGCKGMCDHICLWAASYSSNCKRIRGFSQTPSPVSTLWRVAKAMLDSLLSAQSWTRHYASLTCTKIQSFAFGLCGSPNSRQWVSVSF